MCSGCFLPGLKITYSFLMLSGNIFLGTKSNCHVTQRYTCKKKTSRKDMHCIFKGLSIEIQLHSILGHYSVESYLHQLISLYSSLRGLWMRFLFTFLWEAYEWALLKFPLLQLFNCCYWLAQCNLKSLFLFSFCRKCVLISSHKFSFMTLITNIAGLSEEILKI